MKARLASEGAFNGKRGGSLRPSAHVHIYFLPFGAAFFTAG